MANNFTAYDMVKESSTTTGTGTLTLAGAVTGFRAFSSVIGSGTQKVNYAIQAVDSNGNPTGNWEVGQGTYTFSGTTLSRTTILASSNSGSAVSFTTGTIYVYLVFPAFALNLMGMVAAGYYGDGSDGSLTYDGSTTILGMAPSSSIYTLTRSIYATAITVNNGVTIKTNGFKIHCNGTLTNNGTITANGTVGGNGSAGTGVPAGGAAGTPGAAATTADVGGNAVGGIGGNGGSSGVGNNGSATTSTGFTVTGGNGGTAGAGTGGAGGTGATALYTALTINFLTNILSVQGTIGVGGGAGAGAGGGGGSAAGGGGGGGSGGNGGGVLFIAATTIVNSSGSITSNGGAGGTGGNGFAGAGAGAGGGGGGGGGGGLIYVISGTDKTLAGGTLTVTAGSGGSAGTPHAGAGASNGGGGGLTGTILWYNILTGAWN